MWRLGVPHFQGTPPAVSEPRAGQPDTRYQIPHPALTHPSPNPHPPLTQPSPNPHPTLTQPSPNPHPTHTHPSPNPHPTLTHPSPNPHPTLTQPTPTLHTAHTQPTHNPHPPLTHPSPTPHPTLPCSPFTRKQLAAEQKDGGEGRGLRLCNGAQPPGLRDIGNMWCVRPRPPIECGTASLFRRLRRMPHRTPLWCWA